MSLLYDFPAALLIAVITEWGPEWGPLTYQGEGSFIEVPRNDHGDCDEEFDLGALVSNASVAQSRSLLCDM